jgi:hypothetical protein
MVANIDPGDSFAHSSDNPRTLVSAHSGNRRREVSFEHMAIRSADPCCGHLQEDLAGAGRVEFNSLDRKW